MKLGLLAIFQGSLEFIEDNRNTNDALILPRSLEEYHGTKNCQQTIRYKA